jgi:hypothetical protein
MAAREVWVAKWDELGLLLQRKFWRPLRSMMDIFHMLPMLAVLILFVLLATDGQFRELYISYLEGPQGNPAWLASVVAAFVAIGLISAVLYEAHYALSTMRINVVYSSYSNPEASSKLRGLQRASAFVLAFLPWFGLTVGLLGARNFVANRYCQLLNGALVDPAELGQMQYLSVPDNWTIAGVLIFLGLATAYFSSTGDLNRMAQRAVACLAVPTEAVLFLLITGSLNTDQWTSYSTAICLVIAAATGLYILIYEWLYRRRSGFVYSVLNTGTGTSMRKRRRRWLAVWAFLPWFFLALYFVAFHHVAASAQATDNCPDGVVSVITGPTTSQWAAFPVAMCCTIAMGLLVGHLLGRFSTSKWRRWAVVFMVAALAVAVGSTSWVGGINSVVSMYRFIGPIGTVSLELLFLISTFTLLAVLSQKSGFPALTLIVLGVVVSVMFPNYAGRIVLALGVVCLIFAAMALLSKRIAVAALLAVLPVLVLVNWQQMRTAKVVDQNPPTEDIDPANVRLQFACWLSQRGVAVPSQNACASVGPSTNAGNASGSQANKYPVFIVAAEGGGIYAASATSTFLSRLQQFAPGFDRHVFAISGVSGGSIGASIFQALDHATHPDAPVAAGVASAGDDTACPQAATAERGQGTGSLEQKAGHVMQDDHFSPVVGSIFPEIFGAPLTRSDALVASFEYSTSVQDALAGRDLCAPFAQHWSVAGGAPALVLNSTWAETGFRVAFAPFHLHDLDESLYSFSDPAMPDERDKSLMEAAAVSARFPLIMPPFSVVMKDKRWNFVDGAYSDNSGASTALDLYRALKDVAPQGVDLRIILISSSDPQPDLKGGTINGTAFRDTIAPIDALMKVREDLGNDAVARACSSIYPKEDGATDNPATSKTAKKAPPQQGREANETCIDHAGETKAPLQIVEIQDQTYGLALGWKISATSFAVVSWMLGTPEKCLVQTQLLADFPSSGDQDSAPHQDNVNAQLTDVILQRNSCVLKLIVDLVTNSAVVAAPASGSASPAR